MKKDAILLDHGSGGKQSHDLVSSLILPAFDNSILNMLDDSAVLHISGSRMAFSTDSYVVDPIFFPGGNIGDLAVNGTINDIAMSGAAPLYLSVGLILEEGFPVSDLETIINTMGKAARAAGVRIVAGDTKVVTRGAADKIFINTSGIGLIPEGVFISGANARPGDRIILSGTMADHGITILNQRKGLAFDAPVKSDSAPLNHMVARMLKKSRGVHVLRDPTRGGVGTVLNEIAMQSGVGIRITETTLPVKPAVAGLCELLGLDPLYVANEGKLIAFVEEKDAEGVLAAVKEDPFGADACIIGEVVSMHSRKVVLETAVGGERIVGMPAGESLPRIC
jgi:hydrogenase expression/formation protein HypE